MRIELSGAALATVLFVGLATPARAGDTTAAPGTIQIAQADDQPMVITPHPLNGQQLPPPADPGGPGVPYQAAPGGYAPRPGGGDAYAPPPGAGSQVNGDTYAPPPGGYSSPGGDAYGPASGGQAYVPPPTQGRGTFAIEEIKDAGHRFFGGVSMGLAEAIEFTFQRAGRPNGYILGEEAGGAVIAGVRYGEGVLYTKDAGDHRVYWQGPSVGYDLGAEGSKTMVLVYDLQSPGEIYDTFAGVDGSAYLVGGVGVTFLARGHVILAPIRSGLGLRLGANVGYLKYTREPTWNPF